MRTTAVAVFIDSVGEYLDCVKSGEEVLITEDGVPVVKMSPVEVSKNDDPHRMDLIRRGIIRPGRGPVSMEIFKNLPATNVSREDILRIMDEEREDRA
jgi:antitoxin (DNA-binding transcriptional repressor) of toxin-antitoxin stability system